MLTAAESKKGDPSSKMGGFYTTRQADDEYKIRGCQDEDDKGEGEDGTAAGDPSQDQKKKKRKKRKKNKNK